jgi:hypothetical protein
VRRLVSGQLGGALPSGGRGLVTAALLRTRSRGIQLSYYTSVWLVDRRGPVPGATIGVILQSQHMCEGAMGSAPLDAGGG